MKLKSSPKRRGISPRMQTLIEGGDAGFHAMLAGHREPDGSYARFDAHGFYWTSSEDDSVNAWFYNFAKGPASFNRHSGDMRRAMSVRCVRDSL